MRTAQTPQSLTAVRENFSATWPELGEDGSVEGFCGIGVEGAEPAELVRSGGKVAAPGLRDDKGDSRIDERCRVRARPARTLPLRPTDSSRRRGPPTGVGSRHSMG